MVWFHFDGGCKPNPGMMEVCVIENHVGSHKIHHIPQLGYGTNIMAEWAAVCLAAQIIQESGYDNVVIEGDSQLVVNQIKGLYKTKDADLKIFRSAYMSFVAGKNITLNFIPRRMNLAGIYLENGAI